MDLSVVACALSAHDYRTSEPTRMANPFVDIKDRTTCGPAGLRILSEYMVLSILKLLAVLASGIFAFFALLGDNRDAGGKLTQWGRLAVMGVIISTIIAAIVQSIESYKARVAEEQTRTMIREIGPL